MTLEAAKCPSCGANIQIPTAQEKTFCAYCGSQIITSAAIAYAKVEISGKVQLDTDPAVEAMLIRGRETGEVHYYRKALDLDPNCYEARSVFARTNMTGKKTATNVYVKIVNLIGPKSLARVIRKYQAKPFVSLEQLLGADFFYLNVNDQQELLNEACKAASKIIIDNGTRTLFLALIAVLCGITILLIPLSILLFVIVLKSTCKAKPCIQAIHAYFKVLESKGKVTSEQVSLGKMLAEPLKHDPKCQSDYQKLQEYLATL